MGATWPLAAQVAQPGYLTGTTAPVMAWWHPAQRAGGLPPVVMCPALGDEAIGAYRGWRDLAQSLAEAGVPVLRLDLPGEGDSFDPSGAGDRWPQWCEAVHLAIDALKAREGVAAVHLIGLRLGALLATDVAARRGDVAGVALLAPPGDGRAFLKESRLLAGAEAQQGLAPGEVAVGGFVIDAATAHTLGQLAWPSQAGGPPLLVLERDDRRLPPAAAAALGVWSSACTRQRRDDLAQLTVTAHAAHWPAALGPTWLAWCRALPAHPTDAVAPASHHHWTESGKGDGIRESAVAYAPGRWGVASWPAGAESGAGRQTSAVLLLSSGADRRIGPHRLWVPWARQRAGLGELVLRIDLAGIGDSDGDAGALEEQIYGDRCLQDIAAAISWLKTVQHVDRVAIVGLCSGAYHAWRAAVQALPAEQVLIINPMVFHWRPGTPLDPAQLASGQIHIAASAGRSLRDPARWRKLLRGQVNVGVILRALAARMAQAVRSRWRGFLRTVGARVAQDLAGELRAVARRGVVVDFIFSANDPGRALLAQEAGRALPALLHDGRVHLATIAQADHTFSAPAARQRLYNCLHQRLGAAASGRAPNLEPSPTGAR